MAWFDCAQRRPIGANQSGSISPNLGLILHHQAGNGSLHGFFSNPNSRVSAHFWVAKSDGRIEQYIDTNVQAWHGISLNRRYVGVETEGCPGGNDEPLTNAQIVSLAAIYSEGMRRHGWPNALSNADGQPGFGFHRMAVNTRCPCDIRLARRSDILNMATGKSPAPAPTPPPPTESIEEDDLITEVLKINQQLHQYQASADTLWHWWSDDNGGKWFWERVIAPQGAPIQAKARAVRGAVHGQTQFITCEDSDRVVWMCRQDAGKGWDIRRPSHT